MERLKDLFEIYGIFLGLKHLFGINEILLGFLLGFIGVKILR